jgi:Flp pilus assembly protein TadB
MNWSQRVDEHLRLRRQERFTMLLLLVLALAAFGCALLSLIWCWIFTFVVADVATCVVCLWRLRRISQRIDQIDDAI